MPLPPEVVFDRFLRNELPLKYRGLFRGKQDLEAVPELEIRSLLIAVQNAFNEALRGERNAPEHISHPPFHFDYVDSAVSNAIAFCSQQYSFIGITLPLVYVLWESCVHLSSSADLMAFLGTVPAPESPETIVSFLFSTQLSFVVSHEYTHIVHGTVFRAPDSILVDDILGSGLGNLVIQAHEVDADGYAVYHVLENLLKGMARRQYLSLLNLETESESVQDSVLFAFFVAAVGAFFYVRPPANLDGVDIYLLDHPPQAARMNFVMHYAITWAAQNRPHLASGMTPQRFQDLLSAVARATWGMNGGKNWHAQTAFLQSKEGSTYLKKLDERVKEHIRLL